MSGGGECQEVGSVPDLKPQAVGSPDLEAAHCSLSRTKLELQALAPGVGQARREECLPTEHCQVHGRESRECTPGGYLEGTYMVPRGYLEITWRVPGEYLEGTWRVPGEYLYSTWRVPVGYL